MDKEPQLVENNRYSNDAIIKKTQSFQKMMQDMSNQNISPSQILHLHMQNSEGRQSQLHGPIDPSFMHYSNIPGYASSKPRGAKKSASSGVKAS